MASPAEPAPPRPKAARVFFALWPDTATARRLHELGGKAHASCEGRRMRRENLHLTLAFIGDVSPERLADLVAVGDRVEAEAFTLTIDRIAGWRHNRIVWAGASELPQALAELVARLNAELEQAGFPVEKRPFAAHVTLLRNVRSVLPAADIDPPIRWRAKGFALMESERREDGAHYRPLRQWAAAPAR